MTSKSVLLSLALSLATPLAAADRLLVCLGDSLTAGYGLDEAQAYPALIQSKLPAWRVVNAGVSGDTTAGGLKRLDWILRSRPEAVFVALGANDGLRGTDPKQTEANLRAILRLIKAAGAQAYLAGLDLPSNLGAGYRSDFKAIYPRLAQSEGVPLLPFLLSGVGGVASLNLADGVHPNEAGQRIVAAHVLGFLQPRLQALAPRAKPAGQAPTKVLRRRHLGVAP